jgi:hypothetical protein
MVIGAPRSGTAWASNWLSSGGQLCLHDPLWDHHFEDLDKLTHPNLGIACTGIAFFHQWLNKHPAPKVILHRPREEVNTSLAKIGLGPCPEELFEALWEVQGYHCEWTNLFDPAAVSIHQYLKIGPFDVDRWRALQYLNVTEEYTKRRQDPKVMARIQASPRGFQ